ncbi:hypothetical protein HXX76_015919 [Chlamydomonas incerta]|uniref:Glycosyl transferase CAP10 domain-containing protein n=1 Tax=Chlamydomonas incerta TaxID=51695 RepID=A0A835VRA8_CHLIN|nr:hypothetical protein HXX76_015919 [Chlamydomonas incerta]|eukprot:KAG2422591.1 hypothetical protein HXX76_015919 [Chlamydomonas incerta]
MLASCALGAADWRPPKLTECALHPQIESRIIKDVSFWGDAGISEDVALSVCAFCDLGAQDAGKENCNKPQRVLIQNGTVYLNNLVASQYLGPFEHIGFLVELYEASQVYQLPDAEFTYWFGDNAPSYTMIKEGSGDTTWPWPPRSGSSSSSGSSAGKRQAVPAVLAWSKWDANSALVVPYSGAFRCSPDSWDSLEAQLEALAATNWTERTEVAFGRWNGFCTHYIPWMRTADGEVMKCPRTHLNTISAAHPDLIDAYDLSKGKPVPLAHQNKYKYIVSTDGWSISSKFDKYLLMGSAVLKAASSRYGYYYDALQPGTHYLPFMVNSSADIVDVVRWAKANDGAARAVAEAGRRFALRHLSRPARLCYLARLVRELAGKMRYTPSCSRRQLCVPLVHELRFLAGYERTHKSCRYNEVLLRYGADDPAAVLPLSQSSQPSAFTTAPASPGSGAAGSQEPGPGGVYATPAANLEEIRRLHEGGTAWPRDDQEQQQQSGRRRRQRRQKQRQLQQLQLRQ